jgi:hypothetical protein|eukprot:COSAG01_NODE_1148_length_11519_cov_3.641944_19_plen_65_part_00
MSSAPHEGSTCTIIWAAHVLTNKYIQASTARAARPSMPLVHTPTTAAVHVCAPGRSTPPLRQSS